MLSNHLILYHSLLLLPSILSSENNLYSYHVWHCGETCRKKIEIKKCLLWSQWDVMGEMPRTIAHQTPLPMAFSRPEYWSGLPCPSPGDLPNPRIEPMSPALQADSLSSEPPRKPCRGYYATYKTEGMGNRWQSEYVEHLPMAEGTREDSSEFLWSVSQKSITIEYLR